MSARKRERHTLGNRRRRDAMGARKKKRRAASSNALASCVCKFSFFSGGNGRAIGRVGTFVRWFQSAEVDHNGTLMAAYLLLSLISLSLFFFFSYTRSVSGLTYPRDVSQDVAIAPPPHIPGSLTAPTPTTSTSVNGTQERKIRIQINKKNPAAVNFLYLFRSKKKKTPNVLLNLSIKQKFY